MHGLESDNKNLVLSTELTMQIGHHNGIQKVVLSISSISLWYISHTQSIKWMAKARNVSSCNPVMVANYQLSWWNQIFVCHKRFITPQRNLNGVINEAKCNLGKVKTMTVNAAVSPMWCGEGGSWEVFRGFVMCFCSIYFASLAPFCVGR